MLKTAEFKGTIKEPDASVFVNKFIEEEMSSDAQILDIHYSSNIVNVKKQGESQLSTLILSSILLFYDDGQ